jgi:type 1 glutamine amidotransferase
MRRFARSLSVLAASAALFALSGVATAAETAKKKIVFISGGPSHGFLSHDHLAGCHLLAKRINATPGYEAVVHYKKWPAPEELASAAAIVMYADGGGGHIGIPHKDELLALSKKGIGIGTIHYAVEVPKDKAGPEWLGFQGGYFETFHSVNPHWLGQFSNLPKHDVTKGVKPFKTQDEWYYHMRFRENMQGVTPILSAVPPDKTRQGKDGPHSGNPSVREGVGKNVAEHVLWVSENEGGSRGFGCTGGHFHRNWANDQFRKTVLNAIVWIAKGDIPEAGIDSVRPDVDEMLSNRDPEVKGEQVPENFDKAKFAKELEQINEPFDPNKQAARPLPGEELLKPIATR